MIASEKIDILQIKGVLQKEEPEGTTVPTTVSAEKETMDMLESQYSDYLVIEESVEGLDYKLSKCCNPVFGDKIFGFVTIFEGIKIHRVSCPNANYMITKYPYRVVVAHWTKSKNLPSFFSTIKIIGVEDIGIVNKIVDVISDYKVSMRNFTYNMDEGMFEGILNIMVPNSNILHGIIKKIQLIKGVSKAVRYDNVQ